MIYSSITQETSGKTKLSSTKPEPFGLRKRITGNKHYKVLPIYFNQQQFSLLYCFLLDIMYGNTRGTIVFALIILRLNPIEISWYQPLCLHRSQFDQASSHLKATKKSNIDINRYVCTMQFRTFQMQQNLTISNLVISNLTLSQTKSNSR